MKELNFTSQDLKEYIDEGTLISDSGSFGSVFLHGKDLIKLKKNLYQLLKINRKEVASFVVEDVYRWGKTPFVEKKQIEDLQEKQKNIELTEFDKGIVLVNGTICGTILANHIEYKDLTYYDDLDLITMLKILENILLALKELDDNKVSHLDLCKGERFNPTLNILYRGTDIKLCDLSGEFITYDNTFNPAEMYLEYAKTINFLIKKIIKKDKSMKSLFANLSYDATSYEESLTLLEDIKKLIK